MNNSGQVTLVLGGTGWTIASGHGSRPNDDVLRVTGSPPASVADFAHRNARTWALAVAHP
jgi:hypothetical protein